MRFAAIDIGSNGVRFQVSSLLTYQGEDTLKRLEYIRFPLRLGLDVFSQGSISDEVKSKLLKLISAFKIFLELFEVDEYMACATSAMREAENGEEIVDSIYKATGIEIRIIDGIEEARIINKAISMKLKSRTYLHIDVGGGSTELNLFRNRLKVKSESFRLGTVRKLSENDNRETWASIRKWIERNIEPNDKVLGLGTGGNINKLFIIGDKKPGKSLPVDELQSIRDEINGRSMDERIHLLQLNEDRADVIVPAADIYLGVLKECGASEIYVPNLGLKDGIIQHLYETYKSQLALKFQEKSK